MMPVKGASASTSTKMGKVCRKRILAPHQVEANARQLLADPDEMMIAESMPRHSNAATIDDG
jgi:hypothetical protein